ncbi:OLC1v1021601C1 [Oldenlandia corymbosa var. corymbosa]|uniref:OLC1v1021601C1 n=1 Tax=Oldenlandia corymbosa var. corymbosa TaxID=529605 RepID=A0AAV1BW24_OLDCO|nr:OLC1v1021601C1 [Oldenlandia corymbosa var. corymbosa]
MAFFPTPLPGTTSSPANATPSSLPTTSFPPFAGISGLLKSKKCNKHRFRVACQAKDNEKNASRRNVLIGLGGLYGASSQAADRFSFAAPIQGPDVSNCGPATIREGIPPTNCCPQVPTNIVDFKAPSFSTIRVRPAAHMVDRNYIAKYNRAVQLMKALPDDDPRSFKQQANVHCAYCDAAYDQPGFPNIELQVHFSWLFLPFHRFYLYFFERICGKLIDDPNFTFPFWSYDIPGGMVMPALYTDRNSSLYDPLRDAAHQPPTMMDLDFDGNDSNLPNGEQLSQNLTIMYRQIVANAKTPPLFFGGAYRAGDDPDPGAGSIENIPHSPVHLWTGDRTQPYREDMGSFYSGARDPIFFAHHSNVDRIWSIWKTLGGKRRDITDPDWLNASFLFYDENSQMVRVRVRDCLDTTKLGYKYQDMEIPWLNYRPKPRISKATRMLKKKQLGFYNYTAEDDRSYKEIFPLKLEKTTVKVMVKRPSNKKRSKKEKEEKDELLVIEKIVVDRGQFVKFDVFVNDEDDPKSTPANSEYAGSFWHVPRPKPNQNDSNKDSDDHTDQIKTNLKLSITEILEDLVAEEDDAVAVTLVPKTGKATIGGLKIKIDDGVVLFIDQKHRCLHNLESKFNALGVALKYGDSTQLRYYNL